MPAITWTTLTAADLPVGKAAALVAALQSAALGDGQADPMPGIVANVITRIRAEIAAGGRRVLDADATKIPPSLKPLAMRMALREGQSRINVAGSLELTEQEKEEWRQDVRYLERIAKGEITVEESDNPESSPSVQRKTTRPLVTERTRAWGSANQDGI
ncbi:MAG: hypothetical protein HZA93_13245 [Verrucomicrobia bacterium]|nr:hypothetical protein [Verrucomicrobiota bacterium]